MTPMRSDIMTAGLSALDNRPEFAPLEVPPLYCPLPPVVHPRLEEIHRRSVAWLRGLGFGDTPSWRDRVEQCRSADMSCRFAPDGSEAGLRVYTDWNNLGFMLDDAFLDREPSAVRPGEVLPVLLRLAHVWDHPESEVGEDPFIRGYRDLSLRLRDDFPARTVRNVIDGTVEWWFSAVTFVGHRTNGTASSLSDLAATGSRDYAARAVIALIEIAEGTFLPDAERESRTVRAVTQAASLLVRLVNDLFSYGREQAEQTLDCNLLEALATESGRSLREVVVQAVALHDRVMCLFLALGESLEATASEPLRRYLDQLRHLVRGNLDYSLSAPRYHPESAKGRPRSAASSGAAEAPSDGSLTAPPIPSIAWWWDELGPWTPASPTPTHR